MNENTINPYKQTAQNRIESLQNFVDKVKQQALPPATNAPLPMDVGLDAARRIALAHSNAMEFLETSLEMYKKLKSRGVSDPKIKTYLFSSGVDMAIRQMPGPFLLAAAEFIKRLLNSGNLDSLAEHVGRIFNAPTEEDVERVMQYFKKAPMAKNVSEETFRKKIREVLSRREQTIGKETEAYDEIMRDLGYAESDIPGYVFMLGYIAGEIASKAIPEELG